MVDCQYVTPVVIKSEIGSCESGNLFLGYCEFNVFMKNLPPVFTVLRVLFEESVSTSDRLNSSVEAFVDELEKSPDSVSFEFAPFVLYILTQAGLKVSAH